MILDRCYVSVFFGQLQKYHFLLFELPPLSNSFFFDINMVLHQGLEEEMNTPFVILRDLESSQIPRNYPVSFIRPCLLWFLRLNGCTGPVYFKGVVACLHNCRLPRPVFTSLIQSHIPVTSIQLGNYFQTQPLPECCCWKCISIRVGFRVSQITNRKQL